MLTIILLGGDALQAQEAPAPDLGSWATVPSWPHAAIHMVLLPSGEVMAVGAKLKEVLIWNPTTGARRIDFPGTDSLFCSAHTLLPNGDVLFIGGHTILRATSIADDNPGANGYGSPFTWIYNTTLGMFLPGPSMALGRWYPTAVTLGTGGILVFGGTDENKFPNMVPELALATPAGPAIGPWVELAQAQLQGTGDQINYVQLHLTASGKVLFAAPVTRLRELQPATFTWDPLQFNIGPEFPKQDLGTAMNKRVGESVLLSGGEQVLVYGGNGEDSATADLVTTYPDRRPSVAPLPPLNFGRLNSVPVILPGGQILVVGGTGPLGYSLAPELFDPADPGWTPLQPQPTGRGYHSTALLLPDGRVLSAGGSDSNQKKVEIFSPPYLSLPDRPRILAGPPSIAYGGTYNLEVDDGADLRRATLVRAGSATHGLTFDQRHAELPIEIEGGTVRFQAPENPNAAPPGPYLLFVIDDRGAPSEARMVRLGPVAT